MKRVINTENRSFRAFLWFLLLAYLAVLVKLIILKWPYPYIKEHFLHRYSWSLAKYESKHLFLVPFQNIRLYLFSKDSSIDPIGNLYGNIVGFIPLGILLPLLFKKIRTARATILRVFFFSLGFEVTQLLILLGHFDVDDLILNTLGGAIGYLLFMLLQKRVQVR